MIIKVGNKLLGKKKCFMIAEAGVNYIIEPEDMKKIRAKSSLEVALMMVDAAKEAGVDAIKFQSFTANRLQYRGTNKPQYQINNVGTNDKISYYNLIKKLETNKQDQIEIAKYCKRKGIIFFSTPYDNEWADFLDQVINVPLFKLASIDLKNHLFIRYIAKKGKPFIVSSGLSMFEDVNSLVEMAKKEKFLDKMILMQCTSNYPTPPEDIHLNVIKTYIKEFPDTIVGLSDHSPSYIASIGAVAIGAKVLEKHFTLDKSFKGPDHSSSLNIDELKEWMEKVREIEISMGSYKKKITKKEKRNESMRKYLVIAPQKAGTVITENMLQTMRTGGGILPINKNLKKIIGKTLKKNIKESKPLTWEMIN